MRQRDGWSRREASTPYYGGCSRWECWEDENGNVGLVEIIDFDRFWYKIYLEWLQESAVGMCACEPLGGMG